MTHVPGIINGNVDIKETVDIFENIISCLKAILRERESDSGKTIKKVCLEHGINYLRLVELVKSKPFKYVYIGQLINEVWSKEEDPYELLLRDLLGMPYIGMHYPTDLRDTIILMMNNSLNDREIEIIKMKYGFGDYDKMTIREIGEQFGLSSARIDMIYNTAIHKLRQFKSRELVEYRLIDEELSKKKKELGVVKYKQFYDEALKQYEEINKKSKSTDEAIIKATALSQTITIYDLGFSTRTVNCLRRDKHRSVLLYDLLMMNNTEYMDLWGFGKNSFDEVNKKLNEFLADFGLNRTKFLEAYGKELVTEQF